MPGKKINALTNSAPIGYRYVCVNILAVNSVESKGFPKLVRQALNIKSREITLFFEEMVAEEGLEPPTRGL